MESSSKPSMSNACERKVVGCPYLDRSAWISYSLPNPQLPTMPLPAASLTMLSGVASAA